MLILGIDASVKIASAALFNTENSAVLSEITSGGRKPHSENLMPMIDYVLKTAGVDLREIDLFAVSNGPGSFTGIRIGVATVKGLAFNLDAQKSNCVGVSSLYALAYSFAGFNFCENLLILPVIDARRKQVYNAVINSDGLSYIKHDRIITTAELETELNSEFSGYKIVFTGDGADMCDSEIKFDGKINAPEILKKPSALSLCRAAFKEYKNGRTVHPRILAPSYIIKTQAEREYDKVN